MKKSILYIAAALLSFASCSSEKPKETDQTVGSYELSATKDTINVIINGMKQGLWLMPISKDTVVYLNDTAYSVIAPMTSGEMIRELKSGLRGPVVDFDSLVVNSK